MVLYADILFLVDLSMDFLTLCLCARLTHRPVTLLRMLAGAALGALGSVLLLVTDAGRGTTFFTGLFLAAGMTAVCFGIRPTARASFRSSVRAFFRQYLLVWGSGAITGGCMSMLLSLGTPVYLDTGYGGKRSFWPVFLATTGAVYGLIRLLQKCMSQKTAEVLVVYRGKSARCTVLVDSGNLLLDPLTGRSVILLSRDAAVGLDLPVGEEVGGAGELLLPVPACGVNGTRLLWALRPEMLLVNGTARDALVAAERVPADHYGGFAGTCPVSLV